MKKKLHFTYIYYDRRHANIMREFHKKKTYFVREHGAEKKGQIVKVVPYIFTTYWSE